MSMVDKPRKSINDIAQELGTYAIDAFEFLNEGLDFTVRRIHGPPNNVIDSIIRWLRENDIDSDELDSLLEDGRLPQPVVNAIEHFGGTETFRQRSNRHVGGRELCWGLRDLALEKWGIMAPAVLKSWGIRRTRDFGRMVFALVTNNLLQKQPEDCVEDFDNVFDFDKAFNGQYKINLTTRESEG